MRRGPFVASALLFVGCTQGKSPDVAKGSPAADSDTHVVVVGAGLAGLTVARMLDEVGVTVTVVEARDRIGGRLWTEAVGGVPIDLGGAWVHGPRNNPLSDLADSAGVSLLEDDSRSNAGFDAVAGAAITEGQWQAMSDAYRGFPGELRALRRALGDDASLADGADAWIEDAGLTGAKARGARYAIEHWYGTTDYAAAPEALSLRWFWEEGGFGGGDHLPDGGYALLVDEMADGLTVELGQPVVRVSHGAAGVTLETDSDRFEATHAVITVPLGVLRAGAIDFEPGLSADRQQRIDRLDMGHLEKVVLRYDTAWFRPEGGGTWISAEEDGAWADTVDLTDAAGAPTLAVITGGAFSRDVRSAMSDADILQAVDEMLADLYGRTPPTPLDTAITRWTDDPFARGSYSFVPVGAALADCDALGEPEGDRLLFAGEATTSRYPSTAHGALWTGLREAHRLGVRRFSGAGMEGWERGF